MKEVFDWKRSFQVPRKQEIFWIWTLNGHTARNVHDISWWLHWLHCFILASGLVKEKSLSGTSKLLPSLGELWQNWMCCSHCTCVALHVLGVILESFLRVSMFRFTEEWWNKAVRTIICWRCTVLKIVFGRLSSFSSNSRCEDEGNAKTVKLQSYDSSVTMKEALSKISWQGMLRSQSSRVFSAKLRP